MRRILDSLLHIVELVRELLRPGEWHEWSLPKEGSLEPPIPRDSSCYPYHDRLDPEQLVDEERLP